MKKTILLHNHGLSYVETVISVAIMAIIVISISMVVSKTAKTGVMYKKKVQAHQFAQAIIEDLRKQAKDNFVGIKDTTETYDDFMRGGAGSSSRNDIKAILEVTNDKGVKKVEISITWLDGTLKQRTTVYYHTRITPRGIVETGGIAKGKVLYIAHLDDDNKIPTELDSDVTGGPDEIYSVSYEDHYAPAMGVTVKALSNDADGSYVVTRTNENGEFLLRNIKVDDTVETTVEFYKEGSKPNAPEDKFEQAYYFFDKYPDIDNAEVPMNQRGLYTKDILFPEVGYEEDIGVIICGRTWNFYMQIKYSGLAVDEFKPDEYENPGSVKVLSLPPFGATINGGPLRWGKNDTLQPGCIYWDISDKLLSAPATFIGRTDGGSSPNPATYNLVLRNLRGAYPETHPWPSVGVGRLPVEFEIKRVNGSEPGEYPGSNDFRWGTLRYRSDVFGEYIRFNPVGGTPFNKNDTQFYYKYPQLIAPTINGNPMQEHTQNFHNTLNLVVDKDEYGTYSYPLNVELKRLGWIVGKVKDSTGAMIHGLNVQYRTAGHEEGTSLIYYSTTTNNNLNPEYNYAFYNIVDEAVSLTGFALCAYGTDLVPNYWGMPTPGENLQTNTTNYVDITVFESIDVTGRIQSIANQELLLEVYMRKVDDDYDTVSVTTVYTPAGTDHFMDFNFTSPAYDIKRSVQGYTLPIGARAIEDPSDPTVKWGATNVRFNITVKEDDTNGARIAGANVYVRQYLFDSGVCNKYLDWDSSSPALGTLQANIRYIRTDGNGDVSHTMTVPYVSEWYEIVPLSGSTTNYILTQDPAQPISCYHYRKLNEKFEDRFTKFYYIYVKCNGYRRPGSTANYSYIRYYESNTNFGGIISYAPDLSLLGTDPDTGQATNGIYKYHLQDNSVVTAEIYLVVANTGPTTADTISFSLSFFNDGTAVSVNTITIEDGNFPGGYEYDVSGLTPPYSFLDMPLYEGKVVIKKDVYSPGLSGMEADHEITENPTINPIPLEMGGRDGS